MAKSANEAKTKWSAKETDMLVDEFIVRKVKYLEKMFHK
jgi:hypothetical protein